MGVRGSAVSKDFDKYKKQGLSDSEAMKRVLSGHSKATVNERKATEKKKKEKEKKLLSKVSKNLKSVFGPGHSPAGRRYLAGRVKK